MNTILEKDTRNKKKFNQIAKRIFHNIICNLEKYEITQKKERRAK